MRILPNRLIMVMLAGVFVGLLFFVYGRVIGPLPIVESLGWSALGFGIGVVLLGGLVIAGAQGDGRYMTVRDANPDAFVIQTGPVSQLVDTLMTFEPWLTYDFASSVSATVVLDDAGAHFWLGRSKPALFASIPWAEVEYFKVGAPRESQLSQSGTEQQLVLTAVRGDTVATISFAVERTDNWIPNRSYLQRHELELLAEGANGLR